MVAGPRHHLYLPHVETAAAPGNNASARASLIMDFLAASGRGELGPSGNTTAAAASEIVFSRCLWWLWPPFVREKNRAFWRYRALRICPRGWGFRLFGWAVVYRWSRGCFVCGFGVSIGIFCPGIFHVNRNFEVEFKTAGWAFRRDALLIKVYDSNISDNRL